MRYLGPRAPKLVAYPVAAVSGTILAVCSCTVLPLFASIHQRGAGLGPASAFLYSGPAINVLAIILTARVLGTELGVARAVGAVTFSVVIGALMQIIFRKEEAARQSAGDVFMPEEVKGRALWRIVAALAGKMYGDVSRVWNWVVGAVCLVMGLHLLGVLRFTIPMPLKVQPKTLKVTRATDIMRRAAGGVIILVGAFFVYGALK